MEIETRDERVERERKESKDTRTELIAVLTRSLVEDTETSSLHTLTMTHRQAIWLLGHLGLHK